MSRPAIAIVSDIPAPYAQQLAAHFDVRRLQPGEDVARFAQRHAADVAGLVAIAKVGIPAATLELFPRVRVAALYGMATDRIDLAGLQRRGIAFVHTPLSGVDVAELAIGLLLAAMRQLAQLDAFVREGRWSAGWPPLGRRVAGRRIGLLGLGAIGQAIARRAQALDMLVSYHARTRRDDVPYAYRADVLALAREADVLVVCCPGGEATRSLVSAPVLEALGPSGLLVNVARGSVVDEPALVAALRDGRLGYAALDVFEREPDVDAALRALPNVLLSPHVGNSTVEAREEMGRMVLEGLRRALG